MVQNVRLWNEDGTQGVRALARAVALENTKGKFSEVVTVTNPGKFIFLAGIGPEREGDGKIVHEANFMEQCRYASEPADIGARLRRMWK